VKLHADGRNHPRGAREGAATAMSSSQRRRRVSADSGGSPSIMLLRSVTSRIRSIRWASSLSYGLASATVGPFPKSVISVLYRFPAPRANGADSNTAAASQGPFGQHRTTRLSRPGIGPSAACHSGGIAIVESTVIMWPDHGCKCFNSLAADLRRETRCR
jgi:hypothetical protein